LIYQFNSERFLEDHQDSYTGGGHTNKLLLGLKNIISEFQSTFYQKMSRGLYRSIRANYCTLIKNYEQVDISRKLNRLIIDFLAKQKRVLVLSPNYSRFSTIVSEHLISKQTAHTLELANGAELYFGAYRHVKEMRGVKFDLIVMESMQNEPNVFFKNILPQISMQWTKLVATATEVSEFFESLFALKDMFNKIVLHEKDKEDRQEVLLRLTQGNYKRIKRNNDGF
jgi:hypothetical protein